MVILKPRPHCFIACAHGLQHDLVLTEGGEVYGWGNNMVGQLAGGGEWQHHILVQLKLKD